MFTPEVEKLYIGQRILIKNDSLFADTKIIECVIDEVSPSKTKHKIKWGDNLENSRWIDWFAQTFLETLNS